MDTATESTPFLAEKSSSPRFWALLGCLYAAQFLAALDTAIVVSLSTPIASAFGQAKLYSALGSSYLAASCAFISLYGRLSDVYGRRTLISIATALFALGTLGCGLAGSIWALIGWRAVAGVGAGGLMSMSSIVTTDLVGQRRRGLYGGIGNMIFAAGTATGGPIGGLLYKCKWLGWRGAFLVQLPVAIIVLTGFLLLVRTPGAGSVQVDRYGSITSIIAIVALVLPLQLAGNQLPWSSPIVISLFVVSTVSFVLFVLAERKAVQPIVSLDVLRNRTVALVCISNLLGGAIIMAFYWISPVFFVGVLQFTPLEAGLRLWPVAVALAISAVASGIIATKTGSYRPGLLATVAYLVTPILLVTTWTSAYPTGLRSYIDFVWAGLANGECTPGARLTCAGATMSALYLAMIASVSNELMATVTGLNSLSRLLGQVLGVTLSGSILSHQTSTFPPEWRESLVGLPMDAREAYLDALRVVLRWIIGASLLATLIAFIIPSRELKDTNEAQR